jgi:hypothetical protein
MRAMIAAGLLAGSMILGAAGAAPAAQPQVTEPANASIPTSGEDIYLPGNTYAATRTHGDGHWLQNDYCRIVPTSKVELQAWHGQQITYSWGNMENAQDELVPTWTGPRGIATATEARACSAAQIGAPPVYMSYDRSLGVPFPWYYTTAANPER